MERAALEDAMLPTVGATGNEEVPKGHELAWVERAASSHLPCGPPSRRDTQLVQRRCSLHQAVNKQQCLVPSRVSCLTG